MIRKTIFAILTVVFSIGLIETVFAAEQVDQSFVGPFTRFLPIGTAQEFRPSVNHVSSVDIFPTSPVPHETTLRVAIAEAAGNILGEKTLTIVPSLDGSTTAAIHVLFDSQIPVVPGNTYLLSVKLAGGNPAVKFGASFSNPYAYGDARCSFCPRGADMGFATYYETNPQQQTQTIIDVINDLVNSGDLSKGNGNALVNKLDGAIQKMSNGDNAVAINLLNAFINQVNAYINSGVLTPQDGQQLIDAANSVIQGLQ